VASEPRSIHLTDPRAMRALAHPTRLRLLAELRVRGPQTVGQLSDIVDEAPGSVSFHLSKLATHGFIEQAPELAKNRRERVWRAAHERTHWEPLEVLEDPERRAASHLLRRAVLRRYLDTIEAYLDAESSLRPEWVRAAASSDSLLHLTSDELAQLRSELEDLAARWHSRSDPEREGSRAVTLIYHAFLRP
jgi:DNA-binding transcriptional ArsR family regulator